MSENNSQPESVGAEREPTAASPWQSAPPPDSGGWQEPSHPTAAYGWSSANDQTAAYPTSSYQAAAQAQPGYGGGAPGGGQADYGYPAAPTRRRSSAGLVIAAIAAAGLLGGVAGGAAGFALAERTDNSSSSGGSSSSTSTADLSPRTDNSIAAIARDVSPAVVSISVDAGRESGSGSGVVIRKDGYILTNNHVVEAAASGGASAATLMVHFSSGDSKSAKITGRSASDDLAVIKVNASDLSTATLGDSDDVQVGDTAIAIGSPLGLDGTVTAGIVSALNRPVTAGDTSGGETSFINAIQTDAAINPGNSGGALVNGNAQIIGINSAIATLSDSASQSGSIGLGFAIPINQAKRIADELISTGKSTKPIIGVTLDMQYTGEGAQVTEVTKGGPADDAGIEAGDVITAVNGTRVADGTELIVRIRAHKPGDELTLTLSRDGKRQQVKVTLGSQTQSN